MDPEENSRIWYLKTSKTPPPLSHHSKDKSQAPIQVVLIIKDDTTVSLFPCPTAPLQPGTQCGL